MIGSGGGVLVSREVGATDEELERLRGEVTDQRAVLDALPLATVIKNRQGRFLYVNAAAAAGYGVPCERMIGEHERDVLPPGNDLELLLAQDREVTDSGRSLTTPGQRFRSHDGRSMVLHMTREPVRYRGERAVLVTAFDVLVLLDMSMPGRTVTETHRALRAVLPTVPILLTSGYNDSSVLRDLLAQPATGFIQKPYSIDDLLERCESMLA
jgi:PAS domain S-box-containing protein